MPTKVPPQLLDPATLALMRDTNRIINGDMRIDQRQGGASIAVTSSSVFCVDRFRAGMSGANGTGQRVACSLQGFPFMLQLTGASGTTSAWIGQMIESFNCTSLVGQRVTVQFRAASSNVTSLTVNLKAATAADNFTSTTTVETKTVAITSTLSYYEVTFDATMPAGAANGLYLEFVTGTNLGTGTLQMTGVQLEAGTVATPFAFRHQQHEVALCQRYYYKANAYPLGVTLNVSDGYASVVRYPVPMRANPTLEAGATYSVGSGSAGTPQLQSGNGEAGLMRNSAANWTANQSLSVTAGFIAEIS
jgi:hypothetical protein